MVKELPLAVLALYFDVTAMFFDDPLGQGEPQADAFHVF